jgi:hypothetical protein
LSKPQTYANHARLDPPFHFFVAPVLLINVIVRGIVAFHRKTWLTHWDILVALALLFLAMLMRMYSLKVQDRVIRMEERIRIAAVASPATLARMDEFTIKQLVALRFAPFAELGALADRALAEGLTPNRSNRRLSSGGLIRFGFRSGLISSVGAPAVDLSPALIAGLTRIILGLCAFMRPLPSS